MYLFIKIRYKELHYSLYKHTGFCLQLFSPISKSTCLEYFIISTQIFNKYFKHNLAKTFPPCPFFCSHGLLSQRHPHTATLVPNTKGSTSSLFLFHPQHKSIRKYFGFFISLKHCPAYHHVITGHQELPCIKEKHHLFYHCFEPVFATSLLIQQAARTILLKPYKITPTLYTFYWCPISVRKISKSYHDLEDSMWSDPVQFSWLHLIRWSK